MKKILNFILLILSIGSLIWSILWMVNPKGVYEPTIVALASLVGLISYFVKNEYLSSSNKSDIIGRKNKIKQSIKGEDEKKLKSNQSSVKGDQNVITQKN